MSSIRATNPSIKPGSYRSTGPAGVQAERLTKKKRVEKVGGGMIKLVVHHGAGGDQIRGVVEKFALIVRIKGLGLIVRIKGLLIVRIKEIKELKRNKLIIMNNHLY